MVTTATSSPTIAKRRTISTDIYSSSSSSSSPLSARSTWNSAVAGYVAGFTGTIVGHPFDSLKTWLQTDSVGANKHLVGSGPRPHAAGVAAAVARPPATQRQRLTGFVRALYSGIAGPLVSVGLLKAIDFALYDGTRRLLYARAHPGAGVRDYRDRGSILHVSLGGVASGTLLACVTSPLFRVKQRQQITGHGLRRAAGEVLWTTTTAGHATLNLRGLYAGFAPHLVGSTLGRAVYYGVYEHTKRRCGGADNLSLPERMCCAAAAGVSCWATIFPFDSLRARLWHQSSSSSTPFSTVEMARLMYRERSFFRGFWVTVLRAGPVAAIMLPVYDVVLDRLTG